MAHPAPYPAYMTDRPLGPTDAGSEADMKGTALRTVAVAFLVAVVGLSLGGSRKAEAVFLFPDLTITGVCLYTPLVPNAAYPDNFDTTVALTVANLGTRASTNDVVAWIHPHPVTQKGPAKRFSGSAGIEPGAQKRFKLPVEWYSGLPPTMAVEVSITSGGVLDPMENNTVYFTKPTDIPAC